MFAIRNILLRRKFVFAFGDVWVLCLGLGVCSLLRFRAIVQKDGNLESGQFSLGTRFDAESRCRQSCATPGNRLLASAVMEAAVLLKRLWYPRQD